MRGVAIRGRAPGNLRAIIGGDKNKDKIDVLTK
jgi:hypothetical protein